VTRLAAVAIAAGTTIAAATPVGAQSSPSPNATAGKRHFETLCARCHGGDGNGGEMGPAIVGRLPARSDEDLAHLIHVGLPAAGMPPFPIGGDDTRALVAYLRTLRSDHVTPPRRVDLALADGTALRGTVMNESAHDLQVLADDRKLHLLRKTGDTYRRVSSDADWPTYHGNFDANRFSPLDQITKANVARLAPRWTYSLGATARLQVTPVVVDGVMYVTSGNECHALDAGTGALLWQYRRPRQKDIPGDAGGGINRGVAVAGDRVFMVTTHAHLIALDKATGALLWDTEMADWRKNYGATSAPLAVGGLLITGTSGGDEGVRGFLAAYDQATGREAWRFWTVPRPGEPGSETWAGTDGEHGCATAWFTGSYDPALDTLYWPTGNPCPDYDGSKRRGDNLYSDSILALDPKSGRLKWHFQYTPHDVWDWDAQQPPVLADVTWDGQPRKVLLHANRNGFFYVLDRTDGKLLRATPFVEKLTWAREIGPDGRPVLIPGQEPTPAGYKTCPAVEGATNWFSTAYDAARNLYYVQTLEKCTIYTLSPQEWQAGRSYFGGSTKNVPGEPGQKILRALDVSTGRPAWELPQTGRAESWGGVLGTAGGVLFVAEDGGSLMAVDPANGQPLWHFPANTLWKASPMTYRFDGKQYVAIAAGPSILAFALVD
jgi:alcohol dehydrogenase (cytochrome c)